jgi:hypothetical protein
MAATAKGEDMSEEVFQRAVDLCAEHDDSIQIGGGEPTIHPKFWQFLGYAIGHCDSDGRIWMATNGGVTGTALALAKMARCGVIAVALSQDRWHDPIDLRVVDAFKREPRSFGALEVDDRREIRNVGETYNGACKNPIRAGRWKGEGETTCICEEKFIKPDGVIKQCGCSRSPIIGHVNTGFKALRNKDGETACYRKMKQIKAA